MLKSHFVMSNDGAVNPANVDSILVALLVFHLLTSISSNVSFRNKVLKFVTLLVSQSLMFKEVSFGQYWNAPSKFVTLLVSHLFKS